MHIIHDVTQICEVYLDRRSDRLPIIFKNFQKEI